MSEPSGRDQDTVARDARVDELCDRFEDAYRAGRRPTAAEFMRSQGIDPGTADPALVRELGRVEAAYRAAEVSERVSTATGDGTRPADTHTLPPADRATAPDPDPAGGSTPDIPGYQVIGELARGGMGVVYRAHEPSFGREVAVKVLNERYRGDPGAARRFVAEARLTGRLQHPGVPPMFEVGALPDGSPFLAMKLIEGRTLAAALAAPDRPAPATLVAAFEHICQAVAYAHSRGIIHRDLKPANVMVGAFGEVQVMDWGLAKDLSAPDPPAATDAALPAGDGTRTGAVLGTPAYMAPEQARGHAGRADRRADVFGLGAVLCEALTGKPPFVSLLPGGTLTMAAAGDVGNALARLGACGADPDLVALCRRCLAPDPADRPADAGAVAAAVAALRAAAEGRLKRAELERAAAEGRAAEAVRRRKVLYALAAVLLAGVVTSAAFAFHADRESRRAAGEERKANDALGEVTDALVLAASREGETRAALAEVKSEQQRTAAALDRAVKRLSQLDRATDFLGALFVDLDPTVEEREGQPFRAALAARLARLTEQLDAEAVGDPLVVAKLQANLGRANMALGYPDRAVPLLRKAYATLAAHHGPAHETCLSCANTLGAAMLHLGAAELDVGFYESQARLSEEKYGATDPRTLNSKAALAGAYGLTGAHDRAVAAYQDVLRGFRARPEPDVVQFTAALNGLAVVQHTAGRFDAALELLEESNALVRKRYSPTHPYALLSANNLALAYQETGRTADAIRLYEETLDRMTARHGTNHPDTLLCMHNLGKAYRDARRFKEAIPMLERALEGRAARIGGDHKNTLITMGTLGETYREAGQLDLAVATLEATVRRFRAVLGEDDPETRVAAHNLALAYLNKGQPARAIPLLEVEAAGLRTGPGADADALVRLLRQLGRAHQDVGQYPKARAALEEAIDLCTRPPLAPGKTALRLMHDLARVHTASGDHARAVAVGKRAVANSTAAFGPTDVETIVSMYNLGEAYAFAGRLDDAVAVWEEVLPLADRHAPKHEVWERTARDLAWRYLSGGQSARAVGLFGRVLDAQKAALGPTATGTLAAMHNLGNAHRVAGRLDKALPLLEEAHALAERHAPAGHEVRRELPRALARSYSAAGDSDRAVPLYELALARFKADRGPRAPQAVEIQRELVRLYELAGRWDKVEPIALDLLAHFKRELPKEHGLVLGHYALLGRCRLRLGKYAEAEGTLRECLGVWENWKPDLWCTFHTRGLLGEALLGQKKYAAAEPLLAAAYEGLRKRADTIPEAGRRECLDGALDGLIRLAEAQGRAGDAAKWRAERAKLPPEPAPPPRAVTRP